MDVAILDFGGQYVFNIRRCLSEQGIDTGILPFNTSKRVIQRLGVKGLILSGGPYSVYEKNSPRIDEDILNLGRPILGICYGHQLLAKMLGGIVKKGRVGEFGFTEIRLKDVGNELFRGWNKTEICWMSHGDEVIKLPSGCKILASSRESRIASFQRDYIFGVQFHPEVFHTPKGHILLKNFAVRICGCRQRSWSIEEFVKRRIKDIKEKVGNEKVVMGVSGGIDSSTLAILAKEALGENLICIHVNTGLMRKDESRKVVKRLRSLGLNVISVDASERFLKNLKNVDSPDEKRRIIGRLFVEEFERVARACHAKWLLQGTIAPDVIESTRGSRKRMNHRHTGLIKIHHNVAGLPEKMELKIIEPFKSLFKFQVRLLAEKLNLPEELRERQPFPGPGLGCRIVGEVTHEKISILREITELVEFHLKKYKPSQYFAALVDGRVKPFRSRFLQGLFRDSPSRFYLLRGCAIGVKGDERVMGRMLGIFLGGKRHNWHKLNWIRILQIQNKITGRYKKVCRVFALLNSPEKRGKFGVIIRAVDTLDFMTAIPSKIDFRTLDTIKEWIEKRFTGEISFVGYEITTKPAATIELV